MSKGAASMKIRNRNLKGTISCSEEKPAFYPHSTSMQSSVDWR